MYYSANGRKRRLQLIFLCLLLAVVIYDGKIKKEKPDGSGQVVLAADDGRFYFVGIDGSGSQRIK